MVDLIHSFQEKNYKPIVTEMEICWVHLLKALSER